MPIPHFVGEQKTHPKKSIVPKNGPATWVKNFTRDLYHLATHKNWTLKERIYHGALLAGSLLAMSAGWNQVQETRQNAYFKTVSSITCQVAPNNNESQFVISRNEAESLGQACPPDRFPVYQEHTITTPAGRQYETMSLPERLLEDIKHAAPSSNLEALAALILAPATVYAIGKEIRENLKTMAEEGDLQTPILQELVEPEEAQTIESSEVEVMEEVPAPA